MCEKPVPYAGQSLPHDGYWAEDKKGVPIGEYHERWERGENFLWYCINCHAKQRGFGTDFRGLQMCRDLLGLNIHGDNRNARLEMLRLEGRFNNSNNLHSRSAWTTKFQ